MYFFLSGDLCCAETQSYTGTVADSSRSSLSPGRRGEKRDQLISPVHPQLCTNRTCKLVYPLHLHIYCRSVQNGKSINKLINQYTHSSHMNHTLCFVCLSHVFDLIRVVLGMFSEAMVLSCVGCCPVSLLHGCGLV